MHRQLEQKNRGVFEVHDAVALTKGVYGEPISQDQWMKSRFQQWYQGNVAVISGSTFANDRPHQNESTLDAAAVRKYYDADGVLKRVVSLTLDGLDHNEEVSKDNKSAIEEFDRVVQSTPPDSPVKLKEALVETGKAVRAKRESNKDDKRNIRANGSAVTATAIEYNPDGSMSHTSANIGDTMVVVLDGKTLEIKSMLSARKFKTLDLGYSYNPTALHLVETKPQALSSDATIVSPGDIVIQMTDGVFDDLDTEIAIEEENQGEALTEVHTVKLKKDTFQKVLQDEKSQNEHQIAMTVMNHVNARLIAERQKEAKHFEAFIAWREAHYTRKKDEHGKTILSHMDAHMQEFFEQKKKQHELTVAEWFAWKEQKGETEADKAYPFQQLKEDLQRHYPFMKMGIAENPSLEDRTVAGLYTSIAKRPVFLKGGDCATISVMRVPDPDVELVRALIDFPENRERLALRFNARVEQKKKKNKNFKKDVWLRQIIETLKEEKFIQPGSRGSDATDMQDPAYDGQKFIELLNFFDPPTYAQFIENIPKKTIQTFNQEKLIQDLRMDEKGHPRKVQDRDNMFRAFTQKQILYHKHSTIDSIFGIKNTASWRRTMETIRADASRQLEDELKEIMNTSTTYLEGIQHQIALLKIYKKLPIFNEHRNNSILFGAFGRTQAVIDMDNAIKRLEKKREEHAANLYKQSR